MPTLPIPVFGALVLGFLCLRLVLTQGRITSLASLLAACGMQALIIALAQHYMVPGMRLVQPITATIIPALAWMAFQTTSVRSARPSDIVHVLGPIAALAALVTAPMFLDVLIPGLFVVYGLAILLQSLQGPDAQPRAYLQSGNLPARIWLVIGAVLMASAFSDVLIVVAQIAGAAHLQPWFISIYSVGNLILIGAFGLSGQGHAEPEPEETTASVPEAPDSALWERVQTYMSNERPFLDPDLTLARLARKTGIPAKTLSTTINRATGGNVSRYVNDARIETSKAMLLTGETVTNAMLGSGFNTKSNFNREFLRLTGKSPSAWLADQLDA